MRMILMLLIFLFPATALAATMQAGFPQEIIWVSRQSAIEGETLTVSTVVYNSDTDPLSGTLMFSADEVRIGSRLLELPAGKSQIYSIEWKPRAGEHNITATIESLSTELSGRKTSPILITVAEAPPPSAVEQTISEVAHIASSSVPVVLEIAKKTFDVIEPYRQKGVEGLETYLETSRRRGESDTRSTALGTSTSNIAGFLSDQGDGKVSQGTGSSLLSNLAQAAAASALFVMDSIYLFYPLLALFVLGALYYLARGIKRRPE